MKSETLENTNSTNDESPNWKKELNTLNEVENPLLEINIEKR